MCVSDNYLLSNILKYGLISLLFLFIIYKNKKAF